MIEGAFIIALIAIGVSLVIWYEINQQTRRQDEASMHICKLYEYVDKSQNDILEMKLQISALQRGKENAIDS